jgi:hypothetical protein
VLFAIVAASLAFHAGPAAQTAPASSVHFTSPSGNIDCILSPARPPFVECLVQKANWPQVPKKPASCDLDWVPTEVDMSSKVDTNRRRVSVGACRGDIGPLCVPNTTGRDRCSTLAYGRSVTIGPIRCSSALSGVTCRYTSAPRVGFKVAREGYTLYRA